MPGEKPYNPTEFLRKPATMAAASVEDAAQLPSLATDYKAGGTVDGEVSCLVLVMGKDGFRIGSSAYIILQYVHMGLGEFGFSANGQAFSFVFSDIQPKLLKVEGRNLLRIFHNIGLRRMPWLRQTDRDFRPVDGGLDSEPVITRLQLQDWKRPERAAADLLKSLAEHPPAEMETSMA